MKVLIVGADKIGAFMPKLEEKGVEEVIHWNCRNKKVTGNDIPVRTDLVIFCTDYLHHSAAKVLKRKIKECDVPALYCRRAWSEIEPALSRFIDARQDGCCGRCQQRSEKKRTLN